MSKHLNKIILLLSLFLSFIYIFIWSYINPFAIEQNYNLFINVAVFLVFAIFNYIYIKNYKKPIYLILFSLMISFLFNFSFLMRIVGNAPSTFIILIAAASICAVPTFALFSSFVFEKWSMLKSSTLPNKLSEKYHFIICLLIILISWLPVFLAYFPGNFSYDSNIQTEQIISGVYSTHHPLCHTLLLGLFYNLGKVTHNYTFGIALYNIFQATVLAASISYALVFLRKRNVNQYFYIILLLFFALFPVHSVLAISVTKDVLFSAFTLFFSISLLEYLTADNGKSKRYGIQVIVSAILVFSFRNNARHALVAWSLLWLLFLLFNKFKSKIQKSALF